MSDGFGPVVDEIDGKLTYALPVSSSVVIGGFEFDIQHVDLEVLLADSYRRAVLEEIAHVILQRSMTHANARVTQEAFDNLVSRVLHGDPDELEQYIDQVSLEHKRVIRISIEETIARRSAAGA
jgi:hypothetical protein